MTRETLQQMEQDIPEAAALLPPPLKIQAVGYGCTSGAAQIGPDRVAELVRHGKETSAVSDPLSALRAACQTLGVRRLAILSPYIESVSARLRDVLQAGGIETPVFGGFEEASEEKVARISPASLQAAGAELAQMGDADALLPSCTNLNTLDIIEPLEAETGRPVLSSNQVLAWHLCRLAGCPARPDAPGQLFAHPA